MWNPCPTKNWPTNTTTSANHGSRTGRDSFFSPSAPALTARPGIERGDSSCYSFSEFPSSWQTFNAGRTLAFHSDSTTVTTMDIAKPARPPCGTDIKPLTCIEICAGAGGQALGLEAAGFQGLAHVELDHHACATLRQNRPHWHVIEGDVRNFSATEFRGIDLLAGGVPCPPFSKAGKQLGQDDERDLFPEALRLVEECQPKAVMLENVRGFLDAVFTDYRMRLKEKLNGLGYDASWHLLNASDFGVPQLRPRVVIVAIRRDLSRFFTPPMPLTDGKMPPTVGETLIDLMAANGWEQAIPWASRANEIAPTLVGGSKKHGGADLGPTRARSAWASLGVDGRSLAESAPMPGFSGIPKLTIRMTARIQGFPDSWQFAGGKTSAYRQIGNAFPPPVATAVARRLAEAISPVTSAKQRLLPAN